MSVLVVLLLVVMSVCLTAMVAAYRTLSRSHLQYWARKKDAAALKLYPLKARGSATYLMLELLRALFISGALVLTTVAMNSWAAWLLSSFVIFAAFILLTELYLKPFGMRLLIVFARPLLALTNALKPLTWPLGRIFDAYLEQEPVTLTRSELQSMLDSVQPEDTDLDQREIHMLTNVLSFSHKTVHEVMIPKAKVVTVKVAEALTPVVIDELYKTGHARFPVLGDDGKSVVGILHIHDIMDVKAPSSVEQAMQSRVNYVDEDRDLGQVLQTFFDTKQSVFVVHNQASDMVGLISVEDVVQQIIGKLLDESSKKDTSGEVSASVIE